MILVPDDPFTKKIPNGTWLFVIRIILYNKQPVTNVLLFCLFYLLISPQQDVPATDQVFVLLHRM